MLEIHVLGRLDVRRDGSQVPVSGARRAALIARLALAQGSSVPGPRLVEEIWGVEPGATAANGLQVAVWTLRKRLGADAIETTSGGYALGASVVSDLDRFGAGVTEGERRAAQGDDLGAVANFAAALQLFDGAPLEDVEAPFADAHRAAIAEWRLTTIAQLAAARVRLGVHPPVVRDLAPLIAEHPYREELHATYALALAGVGRRVEALEVIDAVARRLRAEFGVDPGRAVDEARRDILRDRLPAADGRRAAQLHVGLRHVPPTMLGRDGALRRLRGLVSRPDVRLVTVLGPAGVGKTRLAEAVVEADRDGTAFASLTSARERRDLAGVVAAELGVTGDSAGPEEALLRALGSSAGIALLVLDNLEHVPGADLFVDALLAEVPSLTILATSRSPLHLAAEQRFRLDPLPVAPGRSADAKALFRAVAVRRDPSFTLLPDDERALGPIARACDGLPLALELAASWTDVLTVTEIADRLGERLDLLVDAGRESDDRSSSIRASIGWSLSRLPQGATRTLRAAGVFVGGSTVHGLAAVTGFDEARVREHVALLIDRSMLTRTPSGRFELLQVIRETVLAETPGQEADGLRRSHLGHVHAVVARAPRSRMHPSTAAELELLRTEAPNIRAALRFARTTDHRRFVDLLESISSGWLASGDEDELVGWTTEALALPELLPAQRFDALLAAERAVGTRGGTQGRELLREAEGIAEAVDRDRRLALAVRVAYAPLYLGDLDGAAAGAERLRAMLQQGDEPELGLLADQLAALVLVERGDADAGIVVLRRVAAQARAAGLELHARTFTMNLTEVLLWQGRGREAEQVSVAQLAALPADAVMQRTVATRNAGLGRLLQGRAQGADDLLRLALAQMRGRTYVADQLTIALAYAGGLGELPDADRAFLLGAWAAARAAGEVPPTQIDDRLRAMAGGEPDPRAADVLRTGGVAALVDAVVRIILPSAPVEPGGHVSAD